MTDEQGHFNVTRLTPGRYTLFARSPHGYGHSDGSSLVGLGQHVTGIVVKLYPAFRVSGRIVAPDPSRPTCKQSWLQLHQAKPTRSDMITSGYGPIVTPVRKQRIDHDGTIP